MAETRYVKAMTFRRILFVLFLSVAAAGCAAQDPFVYRENEFDRSDAEFNRPITDRDEVTICYASNATTPKEVQFLADTACADAGKRAVFQKHGDWDCPLLTPAAAVFACVPR